MVLLDFGGVEENVVTREEFPIEYAREVLDGEVVAILGYGVQGPAQSLNLRDNGFDVIVGQRKGRSYERALADGWVPEENLFSYEEAAKRGTIIGYLLSDAGQIEQWPVIKPHLTEGKALCFSHGFSITYKDQSGVVPSEDVDVILVAPKGSGLSVRRSFLAGSGINSSYAVYQDPSGTAEDRVKAIGMGIGSGYLFPTTFEKEVYSDLTGERGILVGAILGAFHAQYNVLRGRGHSPSESFNETVEEFTQSLIRLVDEKGFDYMLANISTTAQRGALDWAPRAEQALTPLFEEIYDSVVSGEEARRVIEANSDPMYRENLQVELDELRNSEIWQTGATVRSLRPEAQKPQ